MRTAGGVAENVGGVADHVHLLIGLRATHCLAEVIRDIKAASSEWVRKKIKLPGFSWQEGYGAFTGSPSQREAVKRYIARQPEHHPKKTFQEEYRELLVKAKIEFKEACLW